MTKSSSSAGLPSRTRGASRPPRVSGWSGRDSVSDRRLRTRDLLGPTNGQGRADRTIDPDVRRFRIRDVVGGSPVLLLWIAWAILAAYALGMWVGTFLAGHDEWQMFGSA